ncbi:hypothetical protein ABZX39_22365 [Streptomyces collinus]|uniref:cyanase n=1 Tax=Streptomyces collinus TaxID=42684 RepID=UPI0033B6CF5D
MSRRAGAPSRPPSPGTPTDPTIYLLYEALQVCGLALMEELIHEQFGRSSATNKLGTSTATPPPPQEFLPHASKTSAHRRPAPGLSAAPVLPPQAPPTSGLTPTADTSL